MAELLRVERLTKRFGSVVANEQVDLSLNEGEILIDGDKVHVTGPGGDSG